MARTPARAARPRHDPHAPHLHQAQRAFQRNQAGEAERLCTFILCQTPRHAGALYLSSLIRQRQGRFGEALTLIEQVLAEEPLNAAIHVNRGVLLSALQRHEEALAAHREALRLQPALPEAFDHLGRTLHALGRDDEAQEVYARALRAHPARAEFFCNRGSVLCTMERFDEALTCFDRALALRPDFPEALSSKGDCLRRMDDLDGALDCFAQALKLRPDFIDARYNQANTWMGQNRHREALRGYADVIARQPRHANANWNTAFCHLLLGEFGPGWQHYEWRYHSKGQNSANWHGVNGSCPTWTGQQDLQGRSILVWADEGLGDTLQFCRLLPRLVSQGATVWFGVQPSLEGLLRRSLPPEIHITARSAEIPQTDFDCPLMSLPGRLGVTLDDIPAPVPYLVADPARAPALMPARDGAKLRIGLACSGNPRFIDDRHRSMPLQHYAPLLDCDASFFLIQKECREADAAWLAQEPRITDLSRQLRDFDDTAAILMQLDVVITTDTSVAHLAGALGRPTWVLLAFVPDWRWLLERTDSPWYPTLRLYRQQGIGDWAGVLARVRHDLMQRV